MAKFRNVMSKFEYWNIFIDNGSFVLLEDQFFYLYLVQFSQWPDLKMGVVSFTFRSDKQHGSLSLIASSTIEYLSAYSVKNPLFARYQGFKKDANNIFWQGKYRVSKLIL